MMNHALQFRSYPWLKKGTSKSEVLQCFHYSSVRYSDIDCTKISGEHQQRACSIQLPDLCHFDPLRNEWWNGVRTCNWWTSLCWRGTVTQWFPTKYWQVRVPSRDSMTRQDCECIFQRWDKLRLAIVLFVYPQAKLLDSKWLPKGTVIKRLNRSKFVSHNLQIDEKLVWPQFYSRWVSDIHLIVDLCSNKRLDTNIYLIVILTWDTHPNLFPTNNPDTFWILGISGLNVLVILSPCSRNHINVTEK